MRFLPVVSINMPVHLQTGLSCTQKHNYAQVRSAYAFESTGVWLRRFVDFSDRTVENISFKTDKVQVHFHDSMTQKKLQAKISEFTGRMLVQSQWLAMKEEREALELVPLK